MKRTPMEMSCYRQRARFHRAALMALWNPWEWVIDWDRMLGLNFGSRKDRLGGIP